MGERTALQFLPPASTVPSPRSGRGHEAHGEAVGPRSGHKSPSPGGAASGHRRSILDPAVGQTSPLRGSGCRRFGFPTVGTVGYRTAPASRALRQPDLARLTCNGKCRAEEAAEKPFRTALPLPETAKCAHTLNLRCGRSPLSDCGRASYRFPISPPIPP